MGIIMANTQKLFLPMNRWLNNQLSHMSTTESTPKTIQLKYKVKPEDEDTVEKVG